METSNWNCICKQDNRNVNTFDVVKCTSCETEAHSNCYELYSADAKKSFLCFRCRIEYNDPFYDLEEPLIKPICFYSSETVNQEIPFSVSPSIYSAIKEKKSHSIIAVFTKIVYDSPKYIEQPNTSISVFINSKPLSINPRQDANLDPYIVEGKNSLGIAANKLPSKCIIGIFLGKKVEVKDIAKRILKLESQPTCEEAKRNFESIRFRELEVLAAFPVRDPITNKMMLFAARGSKCRHLQCFDLINYLKFYQNPTDKNWQCFWCKNIVPWRDLRIDQYVYTILKEIREKYNKDELEEIENICFDEKGDWKLQQDFSKEWEESFAMNREKRLKEKRERMEVEHNEEEAKQQQQGAEEAKQPKSELSLEECVNSYNILQKQFSYLLDSEQINETVATKMRELNSFKNFTPYKIYEFFERTMMLIGCALPGIFTTTDEKILFYKLEDLAEMVYKKKLNSMAPLIFSWARTYDDLIILTLLIITRNKRNDPDMALAVELLLCYSWFMETRKVSLEGFIKQNMYQLFGKLIHYFGDKLQWKVQEYATLTIIFKKYIPDLHVPGTIPKKFCDESQKIFGQQADFIVNMLKGFSMSDMIVFLDMVYKPPFEEILQDEDKILRYVFYYFIQIFKKHQPTITNEEITLYFKKWDKYNKAMPVLESEGIKASNITENL